jgi:hypothetical protein
MMHHTRLIRKVPNLVLNTTTTRSFSQQSAHYNVQFGSIRAPDIKNEPTVCVINQFYNSFLTSSSNREHMQKVLPRENLF